MQPSPTSHTSTAPCIVVVSESVGLIRTAGVRDGEERGSTACTHQVLPPSREVEKRRCCLASPSQPALLACQAAASRVCPSTGHRSMCAMCAYVSPAAAPSVSCRYSQSYSTALMGLPAVRVLTHQVRTIPTTRRRHRAQGIYDVRAHWRDVLTEPLTCSGRQERELSECNKQAAGDRWGCFPSSRCSPSQQPAHSVIYSVIYSVNSV